MLSKHFALIFFFLLSTSSASIAQSQPRAQASPQNSQEQDKSLANDNTVYLLASSPDSIYTDYASDMAKVLDDRKGNTLRVLPVLSRGAQYNLFDLLNLRGIDMALTESFMLEQFEKDDPVKYANIRQRIHYITKVANTEYHIVTKRNIKSISELEGKKVNFFVKESGTAYVGLDMFRILGIKIEPVFLFGDEAQVKLKNGEIAAAARATGAPGPHLLEYKEEDDLHLLPIDGSLPNYEKLRQRYIPAILTSEQYPALISAGQSIPTIANATMLAVYAWPEKSQRYQRVANFVNKFFDNVDKFMVKPRHPKWREINLAADIEGWTRFKAARDWLDRHGNKPKENIAGIRDAFEKFMGNYVKQNPQVKMDEDKMKVLTSEFIEWWRVRNPAQ